MSLSRHLAAAVLSIAATANGSWLVLSGMAYTTREGLFSATGCSDAGVCITGDSFCAISGVPTSVDVGVPCTWLKAAAGLSVVADILGIVAALPYALIFVKGDYPLAFYLAFAGSAILAFFNIITMSLVVAIRYSPLFVSYIASSHSVAYGAGLPLCIVSWLAASAACVALPFVYKAL
ncbi:hypothetical protein HK405_000120 [Cladochytrium tenue]|nr:hypothetical protein HK405_000120 [Cladochytrium tenue]